MAPAERASWLSSDRFLARTVARPLRRFLQIEAAGGAMLVVAAAIALVWANSPWAASYHDLWSAVLTLDLAGHVVSEDLRHWINDGLMALFFLVIGLEIKHELVNGELASPRRAAVPIVGAIGGMAVPAVVYLAFNVSGDGSAGWGIPMATDVAFALGVLAVLGDRVPAQLKILLLGLAIVDDVGAIVIIAAFYSTGIHAGWLAAAAAGLVLVALLRRARVRYMPIYVICGAGIWFATFQSGVHATIAGVALGLLAPARPFLPEVDADRIAGELSADEAVTAEEVRDISFRIRESIPTTERLQELLHPWTSYLIVPLFALANAGIAISAASVGEAATSPITLGVIAGLVVGKLAGISGGIALAVRSGLGRLPEGVTMWQVTGMAGVAGIGFTVSIFVAGLAFADPLRTDEAILGVLVASLLAASLGSTILLTQRFGARDPGADDQSATNTGAAGPMAPPPRSPR